MTAVSTKLLPLAPLVTVVRGSLTFGPEVGAPPVVVVVEVVVQAPPVVIEMVVTAAKPSLQSLGGSLNGLWLSSRRAALRKRDSPKKGNGSLDTGYDS